MEGISIKNFAGIDKLEINLNKINIFIGSQASGKSVTAKLIYFFKRVPDEFRKVVAEGRVRKEVDVNLLSKFETYFPADTWPSSGFEIVYYFNGHHISIRKGKAKPKISYSETINNLFDLFEKNRKIHKGRGNFEKLSYTFDHYEEYLKIVKKELGEDTNFNPLFIPAGRSFFANLQNSIFSFLSGNNAIDPFLIEFGSYYESVKLMEHRLPMDQTSRQIDSMVNSLIFEICGGKYHREKNKDYLIHADKRKINVSYSSSGQQETLPLLLILKSLLRVNFLDSGTSLFIEEPEAHLFPAAQKKVIELMALIFNQELDNTQLIITTHSPYILTSINNLVQASIIHKSVSEKVKKKVEKIISKYLMIDTAFLNAYAFKDGGAESIINAETGLIHAAYLDKVSEEIAIQFDSLLNLY